MNGMEVYAPQPACQNLSPERGRSLLVLLPGKMCCGQDLHQCTGIRYACHGCHKMREPRNKA